MVGWKRIGGSSIVFFRHLPKVVFLFICLLLNVCLGMSEGWHLSDKVKHLDKFNLYLFQGGHVENFRLRMTEGVILKYLSMVEEYNKGSNII